MSVVTFAATLGYGWALDRHAPLAVIIILTFISPSPLPSARRSPAHPRSTVAYGCSAAMNSVTVYAVDLFPSSAAGATAALNLLRCELGAGGTAVVDPIVRAIGTGPTFSIAFGIGIASLLLPWMGMRWGPRWRRKREAREKASGKVVDRR